MTDDLDFRPLERYRVEGKTVVIEMTLEEPYDIYNAKDPSPLRMRDFKKDVEKYITDSLREIPKNKKIRVVFYFDKFLNEQKEQELLYKSYKEFFSTEVKIKRLETKQKFMRGLKFLLTGSLFLFSCIFISHFLNKNVDSIFKSFFLEGLNVLGWVSLWNPVQIFLYEIWPIIDDRKILERALNAHVEFKDIKEMPDDRKYI